MNLNELKGFEILWILLLLFHLHPSIPLLLWQNYKCWDQQQGPSYNKQNITTSPTMFSSPFLSCTQVGYPGLDEHDQVLIQDDVHQGVGHTGQGEQVVKNLQAGP